MGTSPFSAFPPTPCPVLGRDACSQQLASSTRQSPVPLPRGLPQGHASAVENRCFGRVGEREAGQGTQVSIDSQQPLVLSHRWAQVLESGSYQVGCLLAL